VTCWPNQVKINNVSLSMTVCTTKDSIAADRSVSEGI
jgi:hypothetical protein